MPHELLTPGTPLKLSFASQTVAAAPLPENQRSTWTGTPRAWRGPAVPVNTAVSAFTASSQEEWPTQLHAATGRGIVMTAPNEMRRPMATAAARRPGRVVRVS
jgi:hypothetical protein